MHKLFMNKTLNSKYHKPKANIKAKLSYNYGPHLGKGGVAYNTVGSFTVFSVL